MFRTKYLPTLPGTVLHPTSNILHPTSTRSHMFINDEVINQSSPIRKVADSHSDSLYYVLRMYVVRSKTGHRLPSRSCREWRIVVYIDPGLLNRMMICQVVRRGDFNPEPRSFPFFSLMGTWHLLCYVSK